MAEALLSDAEKTFLIHGIQEDLRADGRGCLDYRHVEVETDVVSNCNGSAHVRLANTDVLVGVKAELDSPDLARPNSGRIEFYVDCTANADPEFEGRGGQEVAQEICELLSSAYSNPNCLDLKTLCVIPGQQVWILYIDTLVLEVGGSLADAASIAVKAALHNTRIPKVSVSTDEDGNCELEVSDDPYESQPVDVSKLPCLVSLSRIAQKFVVDCTPAEEVCSLGKLVMGVNQKGQVSLTRKTGPGSLHVNSVLDILEVGQKIGITLNEELDKKLESEKVLKKERRGFL